MSEKRGRKPKSANTKPAGPDTKAPIAGKVGPDLERPQPPEDFDAIELAAWRSLCDDLAKLGSLHSADRAVMECYCSTFATFHRIRAQLRSERLTSLCPANGRTWLNPLISSQSDYANRLRGLLNDLGLTPRSRRAPQGQGDEADPMTAFLNEAMRR